MTGRVIFDGSDNGVLMPDVVTLPASASVGHLLKVGANNQLVYQAGGGGGITIGDPVSGGGANRILFEDGSQDLGADAGLTFGLSGANYLEFLKNDATFVVGSADYGDYVQIDVQSGSAEVWFSGLGGTKTLRIESEFDVGVQNLHIKDNVGTPIITFDGFTDEVTIPSLAGVGVRTVKVDANGKLSAP